MRYPSTTYLWLVLLVLAALPGFAAAPVISSFTPYRGGPDEVVTIYGSDFTGATAVKFNSSPAYFTVKSDGVVSARVPHQATTGPITITTPSGTAVSADAFFVKPTIDTFWPPSGGPGNSVTIDGHNFTGAYDVKFNGMRAKFTVVNDSQVSAVVPPGTTSGKITVTTSIGSATSTNSFGSVLPAITSFSPARGRAGEPVVIKGSGFNDALSVSFGGIWATKATKLSDSYIRADVPEGAITGPIRVVSTQAIAWSRDPFYIDPPFIASFTPTSGNSGQMVNIYGGGFALATAVYFYGQWAQFTVNSDSSIQAIVPGNTETGPIKVYAPNGSATSERNFETNCPTISSFTPQSGKVGDLVTITGTNFTGTTSVKFYQQSAEFEVVSDTTLRAKVPTGVSYELIHVTTPDGTAYSLEGFQVNPPVIASFNPVKGKPGDSITIVGSNLAPATEVYFNRKSANFTVNSDTSITATVPVGTTTGKIHVNTPSGSAFSDISFSTNIPTISSFTPTSGSDQQEVTITGTGFTEVTKVAFGGGWASITVMSDEVIKAWVYEASGSVTGHITVTTPGGTATSQGIFYVNPPTITYCTPMRGSSGQVVTITGTNFTKVKSVLIAWVPAQFAVKDSTSMTAIVPDGATTGPIEVNTEAGWAGSEFEFSTLAPTPLYWGANNADYGSLVYIYGRNYTGTTSVKFNGKSSLFTVVDDTNIIAEVPYGATTGYITVTTALGTATSFYKFTVAYPKIISFTPMGGSIGQFVTITGTNFTQVSAVKFNGVASQNVTVKQKGYTVEVTATVPEGATTGEITITSPDGVARRNSVFTVYEPRPLEVNVEPGAGYAGSLGDAQLSYLLQGPQQYLGTLPLDASGKAFLSGLQPGIYSLSLYGSHWLRQIVRGIDLTSVNPANFALVNGDADGDNQVNLFDFVVLDTNFGKSTPMADLDGDGQVNLFDYVIIDQSFGARGD